MYRAGFRGVGLCARVHILPPNAFPNALKAMQRGALTNKAAWQVFCERITCRTPPRRDTEKRGSVADWTEIISEARIRAAGRYVVRELGVVVKERFFLKKM